MWRYAEVLPAAPPVTLGEGATALIHARRQGQRFGLDRLYIKDEGLNPTGSFKARGLSAAVSMARTLGVETVALPTAGNAGGAAAAYAAQAGLKCVVAMPSDTPSANVLEARAFGADVRLLDGLISDCGRFIAANAAEHGWFDLSTLKEPYRIEGKKTMGFELWEEFGGDLPEVIVYPTGGGVGLIGMWKAFEEMERMGLIGAERPRMISVQVWDRSQVGAVDKAIRNSDLGLNPMVDGQLLRIPIPELNEERRRELAKVAAKYAEQARVAVRNVRRDGMDQLKRLEKEGHIGEDEHKAWSDEVQQLTDQTISEIDELLATKEAEIIQV